MSNFFEQELWYLFGDEQVIDTPYCSGQSCYGTLDRDLRVRIQFISTHISGQYDALKLTVLNRINGPVRDLRVRIQFISTHISGQYDALKLTVLNRINGPVDIQVLKLGDILGKKPIPGNPNFREGVAPHIWDNYGKFEWYAYRPTEADYETVRQAVGRYLDVFRDRTLERTRNGPKLVYICAPLRGDVEQNITFAKEKAREVFQAGDIPICPHLMFPPFADPDDPVQDQAAREMGLRLVEHCQQVNVYGPVRTPGMLAEIRRAEELRIPVKADQPGLQKTKGRPRRGQSR